MIRTVYPLNCHCVYVVHTELVFGSQEQSLLQPPTLQLLNGMGPLGRRASDGGANIQLHAQLLKRPRGPSPLVTSPVRIVLVLLLLLLVSCT